MAKKKEHYRWAARGFVAPGVLLVAVLLYLPLLWTLFLSFSTYNGLGEPKWAGLANYLEMFQDPDFLSSMFNTLLWVVGTLAVPVGLGLVLALMTWNLKGGVWLRLPFLIPYAISGIGVGLIWSFVLQSNGALDQALHAFGVGDTPRWLLDAPLNTIVMIVAASWQGVGVNALLFSIGLQSIPKEPLEAARLDGAGGVAPLSQHPLADVAPVDDCRHRPVDRCQPQDLRHRPRDDERRTGARLRDSRTHHVQRHLRQ